MGYRRSTKNLNLSFTVPTATALRFASASNTLVASSPSPASSASVSSSIPLSASALLSAGPDLRQEGELTLGLPSLPTLSTTSALLASGDLEEDMAVSAAMHLCCPGPLLLMDDTGIATCGACERSTWI